MMNCYQEWYRHYVGGVWRVRQFEEELIRSTQLEMSLRNVAPATPDLYAARMTENRSWLHLHDVLDAAVADASSVSIHRHWLNDVVEELAQEFTYQELLNEADTLRSNLAKHELYTQEKEHCRAVQHALQDYAGAMKYLIRAEREAYEEIFNCESHN